MNIFEKCMFHRYADWVYYIFLYQFTSTYFRFQDVFAMLNDNEITGLHFPLVDGSLADKTCEIVWVELVNDLVHNMWTCLFK